MPTKRRKKLWTSILKGKCEFKFIRDFLVSEGKLFKSESVIMHVPSGIWRGFNMPYQVAVERLESTTQGDDELISTIFEV